ncbi:MAG TPA: hypothetical protein PLL30_05585 [Candidatus Krumholzibacteria bacterium]|nr:hypothetical protein [Candidatus Krumholzibacteria bacterium]HPD71234.1 hypothetical protein [Candidatus Krumholzibacteria bacterium]HRY39066.1 hypothetical protein [Candidatus Krumholzibacteria bacterium]
MIAGGRVRVSGQSILVALALLGLTVAALLWPRRPAEHGDGTLLAYLPAADGDRQEALEALAAYLGREAGLSLQLEIAGDRLSFGAGLAGALVVLAPDGPALALPAAGWQPLAAGRRPAPWNLRPTAVLVSRQSAAADPAPWLTAPARTVFGDSLSLVCLAPLCSADARGSLPPGVTWGRDPYDHRDVLVAAAYGVFDHAVVRQWDADAALAAGRLEPGAWRVRRLSDPVPDLMVLGSRRLPAAARLDLQQALTVLGRDASDQSAATRLVRLQLGQLGLDGFNLVLGPDFERLRRHYSHCWPRLVD